MAETDAVALATARIPGIDVARALAVWGMILVNFKLQMHAGPHGPDLLVRIHERLDGRAATLFVLLAGVGISLRSRRARTDRSQLRAERIALAERALVLFVAGLLNLHIWEWDILHFYGLYLLLATAVLAAPGWVLLALAVVSACLVTVDLPFLPEQEVDLWTPTGMALDLTFDGLHPVVPWMSFLLVGMWLGRQPLAEPRVRRSLFAVALVAWIAAELVAALPLSEQLMGDAFWLSTRSWPPGPLFVTAATGSAVVAVCGCIEVTQSRADQRWVVALVATGQLAFTLYIAHAIAILVPLQHGVFEGAQLWVSIAYSVVFFAVAVAGSVWWRRRYPHGPLEGLIRQITGRRSAAPWGGDLA